MVSKCANPECAATFRYFHQGKLFRLDTESGYDRRRDMSGEEGMRKPLRHVEFYWLCEDCAGRMVLSREKGVVSVRPIALAAGMAA